MSDNYVILVPEDPRYIPDHVQIASSLAITQELFPRADGVQVLLPKGIEFFHAGTNWERVCCPECGMELSDTWWGEAVEIDSDESGFRMGLFQTPCCGGRFTLNDLRYEWPQRFGSFGLEVQNPNVGLLKAEDVVALELALGTFLRVVYRHL